MLTRIWSRFGPDLAVDLGTANTLVAVVGEGLVVDEPTVVAVDQESRHILGRGSAVGRLAKQLTGRTPDSIAVVRPLAAGVITDFRLCEAMLRYFFRKALRQRWTRPPRVLVAIPGGITPVEKRALFTSVARAGARQVFLVRESLAAALGSGLPVAEPRAQMIVDLGGGTTDVAVLSLGDCVSACSLRSGGDAWDDALVAHLRRHYGLRVSTTAAERLRIEIGSAAPLAEELADEIRGIDAISGLPRKVQVTSQEVRQALAPALDTLVGAIRQTLDGTPPELAADLVDSGLTLSGGGALLRGMDRYLHQHTGLPVRLADRPLSAVVRGTLQALENFSQWHGRWETDSDDV